MCRIGHEQLLFQHLPVLKNHDAVQVFGAVSDGLEIGGESLVHVGGSLSARERSPAAGAGGEKDRRCSKKEETFHDKRLLHTKDKTIFAELFRAPERR